MPTKKTEYAVVSAIAFALLLGATNQNQQYSADLRSDVTRYTSGLPFDMPAITLPAFADRTYDVRSFGCVGDGRTLNTGSFQKAIDQCSSDGGGMVVVPPGMWMTGPINLKSGVNLHLERGAVIEFSRNHSDYPIVNIPGRGWTVESPITGVGLEDVGITGPGLIDGNGITWRPVKKSKVSPDLWKSLVKSGGVVTDDGSMWWPSGEAAGGKDFLQKLKESKSKKDLTAQDFLPARDFVRPILVLLVDCKRVLLDGTTFQNSPMYALYPTWCEDVVIRNVKINNEYWAQNGDGIDISSSKNVLVCKSTVEAGDDGICMKSSPDKNAASPTLRNVVIADCVVYHAHGGFVIGSNIDGGMENISVKNCDYIGTDIGLRFKSARGRGGLVSNVFVSNIYMKDIVNEAILFDTYYEGLGPGEGSSQEKVAIQPVDEKTPVFRNFHIDSVYCDGAKQAVHAFGLPEMPVQDISISNSSIIADKGLDSRYTSGFILKNVNIYPRDGTVYSLYDTKDFTIEKGICPDGTDVFVSVSGKSSGNIKVIDTPLNTARTPVKYEDGADSSAVIVK